MKRLSILLLAAILAVASGWAIPALKGGRSVKQPDGTSVTIRLHGDEYLHYHTTDDGYTVVKDARGYYVYAEKMGGELVPTQLVAHDAGHRTASELSFLHKAKKHLQPAISKEMAEMRSQNQAMRAKRLAQHKAQRIDYDKFKGLVILAEYSDCKFRYDDYHDIMDHMLNDENYTGEARTNVLRNEGNNRYFVGKDVIFTGSMHDYFHDNSMGMFSPKFDIVGPVSVNRTQTYVKASRNSAQLIKDACTAADQLVNFADYDNDGDGEVDIIYVIFAGLPSYIEGNNPDYLWPHQSSLAYGSTVRKDGVRLGYYSCSTELYGYEDSGWSILEGIGAMCHEFSHALGLPDFYDTGNSDGEDNCVNPDEWSIMAAGAQTNFGRTPSGYSLFERYALGFANPKVITGEGTFTMDYLGTSNEGYRLNTRVGKEFFLLENRQKSKWDAELPGHGMLIFRTDSTNANLWFSNSVNDLPSHPCYELLRAGGVKYQGGYRVGAASDPFPGTNRVTAVNNETTPNLKTWAGYNSKMGLRNITEKNGQISFDVYDVTILTALTLKDQLLLPIGASMPFTATPTPATAEYTLTWSTDNASVATVTADGMVTAVAAGTANITATADNGVSATCQVTVRDMNVVTSIANFCQMDENAEGMLQLTEADVIYVKGQDIYLRDASGAIILRNTGISVSRNDRLNGFVYGRFAIDNRMPLLTKVEGMTNGNSIVITKDATPEPLPLHLGQLSSRHYANMVLVKKAVLAKDGGIWATFGDKRVRLYNTLGVTSPKINVPSDLSKRYDITAIYGTNTLNGELIDELYLLKSPVAATYTAPTAISLPAEQLIEEGRSCQLQFTVEPSAADVFLNWTSSDENVLTVSQEGLVAAKGIGTALVTATDMETGLQAQCQVTVGERLSMPDIAAFRALAEGAEADLKLTNAQVLYVHNLDIYLRDASGCIVLHNTGLRVSPNQLLNGYLFGSLQYSNGMPMLCKVSDVTDLTTVSIGEGEVAQPRTVSMEQLSDNDLCDYVLVKATRLERDGGIYAVGGDNRARLYNTFGISGIKVPSILEGKLFDVTAIYGTNTLSGQPIYELKLLKSPEETSTFGIDTVKDSQTATVCYDLNGRQLNAAPTRGIYVVMQNGRYVKVVK